MRARNSTKNSAECSYCLTRILTGIQEEWTWIFFYHERSALRQSGATHEATHEVTHEVTHKATLIRRVVRHS